MMAMMMTMTGLRPEIWITYERACSLYRINRHGFFSAVSVKHINSCVVNHKLMYLKIDIAELFDKR